jgi:pimeloyl-ACP methyl ester carboxylesterase
MTLRTALVMLAIAGCTTTDPIEDATSGQDGSGSTNAEDGATASLDGDGDGDGDGASATSGGGNDSTPADEGDAESGAVSSDTAADDDTTGGASQGDPREPGPFAFTMSTFALDVDGTAIPLTIYLPDDPGPHPVVVLTHGFQLSPADYASYGEHLASWGYVAVLPQMPGTLLDPATHVELRALLVGVLDWIEAVAADAAGPLEGRADADAIGLAGHSMGGKISFLTASSDARPRAVFGIDPVDAAGGPGQSPSPAYPSVTPELMPLVVVPIAVVGETTNATGGLGGACAPEADNFQQYFQHATSPALQIEVLGANHMSFLDDPMCGLACVACPAGTDDPALTRRITQGHMIAFFGRTLKDEAGWTEWLTGAPMEADVDAGLVTFATANGF